MNIKFQDLQRQYKSIQKDIDEAIFRVIKKQAFILGEEGMQFEKEFASYLGVKYFVGVNSGTDGLWLALWSLGIAKGDEVIIPVNSFVATALAIKLVGATPVLVDIDDETYQIDCQEVEKKITKRTKAIMPVHLYGAPCNLRELKKITRRENLFLIEDAAQAHGAMIEKKKVGGIGDLGVFSFYPVKNLGAYGDGGGVATDSRQLYEQLMKLRNYGQNKKYYHDTIGVNSRLDEIQAAVLRIKLRHLDSWNEARQKNAIHFNDKLINIKTQKMYANCLSVYHLFVIEHENREKLITYLDEKGVQTLIHYPLPISLQKSFSYLGHKVGEFPKAERVADKILSLPMYSELTDKEIIHITDVINKFTNN